MAAPLLGIPLLAKALTAIKGGSALKAAAGFGAGLPKAAAATKVVGGMPGAAKTVSLVGGMPGAAMKTAATKTGAAANAAKAGINEIRRKATEELAEDGLMRMAGSKLADVGRFFVNNAGDTKTEVALRLAPDLAFGVLGGVMTPGDLGDKIIAGTTQAAGGALGGIGAAGLARKMGANPGIQTLVDMGGSIAGDFIGMNVGDSLMRVKGGGMTPYEKQYALQDEARKQQILDEFLMANGLG